MCSQLLAYDLDYVAIPAQDARQVAAYVDGALARRVASAADVASGVDTYWASAVEGRVLVLANVAADAGDASRLTLAALPAGLAAPATLAELDALAATGAVEGAFTSLSSGEILGRFSGFHASATGLAEIHDVRSAVALFDAIRFPDARSEIDGVAGSLFTMTSSVGSQAIATTVVADDV